MRLYPDVFVWPADTPVSTSICPDTNTGSQRRKYEEAYFKAGWCFQESAIKWCQWSSTRAQAHICCRRFVLSFLLNKNIFRLCTGFICNAVSEWWMTWTWGSPSDTAAAPGPSQGRGDKAAILKKTSACESVCSREDAFLLLLLLYSECHLGIVYRLLIGITWAPDVPQWSETIRIERWVKISADWCSPPQQAQRRHKLLPESVTTCWGHLSKVMWSPQSWWTCCVVTSKESVHRDIKVTCKQTCNANQGC